VANCKVRQVLVVVDVRQANGEEAGSAGCISCRISRSHSENHIVAEALVISSFRTESSQYFEVFNWFHATLLLDLALYPHATIKY
jgi:hypothetical protein